MTLIVFYGLAATAVTAAILVVLMSRVVYSALALIVCFGATAGLFFQLGAQFIAAVQVIVYAGAIMVLFLFVIMLLDPASEVFLPSRLKRVPVFALACAVLFTLVLLEAADRWAAAQVFTDSIAGTERSSGPGGEIETLAHSLFRDYLLPFEVTSILILVAVLGAVVLTRQHHETE
ncbi:MAG: NADH-quinone oxidoreductase subunit J [Acidobacteria bacterium]|nr:NADH-quinone oxidoreductase subunit J [Acidobacteriota bacterium]